MAVTILIDEYNCEVTRTDSNGASVTKTVDPQELATALSRQARIDTGLLPPATRYYACNNGIITIVIEVRPQCRMVHFEGAGIDKALVPFPGMLFKLTLTPRNDALALTRSSLSVFKDPVATPETKLFRFPYGNVFDNSSICWGFVQMPVIKDVVQANRFPELFLSSRFNGHIDYDIVRVPAGDPYLVAENRNPNVPITLRGRDAAVWLGTHDVKIFPYDWLIPQPYFATVQSFLGGQNG